MNRYKITMPDGSWTEESFESDKDAISCATEVNRGVSDHVVVERYAQDGHPDSHYPNRSQSLIRRKTHRPKN